MILSNWSICSILLFSLASATDRCPEPEVTNGQVSGRASPDFFSGHVRCNVGFHLVGNPGIKCRAGIWSGFIPVCAAIGSCPALPLVENGRNIPIRGSRQSAVKFSCYRGFVLVGERMSHCMGERWSVRDLPVCVRAVCEEGGMADIPYGEVTKEEGGAVYRYQCEEGVTIEGSDMLYCDGRKWNGTVPSCLVPPSAPEIEIILSGTPVVTFIQPGHPVLVSCQANSGNPFPEVEIYIYGDLVSRNGTFVFEASEEDDDMDIKCVAHNKAGRAETKRSVKVKRATIIGPVQAVQGESVELSCNLGGTRPTESVSWLAEVDGREVIEADVINEGVEEEFGEATVNIKIDLDTGIEKIRFQCIAIIDGLGEIKSQVHDIKIVSPPSPPTLFGIREGSDIEAGEAVMLTCSTEFDNLVWLIDGEVAGEGSEDMRDDTRIVSNWWFAPYMGESMVECRDGGKIAKSAVVTFNVVDNNKGVTLATDEDEPVTGEYEPMEDNNDNFTEDIHTSVEDTDFEYEYEPMEDNNDNITDEVKTSVEEYDVEQDTVQEKANAENQQNTLEGSDVVDNILVEASEGINSLSVNFTEGTLVTDTIAQLNENTKKPTDYDAVEYDATAGKKEEQVSDEPIIPEHEPEAEVAKVKDSSFSNNVQDSVKSSFISIESSSSSKFSFSSLLFLLVTFIY